MAETTLSDVLEFISLSANDGDVDRINDVLRLRMRTLSAVRAAGVKAGQTVTIRGISPKALAGLVGVLVEHNGKHGKIMLDGASTNALRHTRTRYASRIASDATEYLLNGVPLSCCVPVGSEASHD